jgi:hypothetical protein
LLSPFPLLRTIRMAPASWRGQGAPWASLTKISRGGAPQAERETVIAGGLPGEAPLRQNPLSNISILKEASCAMSLSMYQASVPAFLSMLKNLTAILDKGEAFAAEHNIAPEVLVNWRLAPDMFPFSRQIQIAADFAKGTTARLAGAEVPSYPDEEKTFAELKARIAKTVKFVQGFSVKQIDGSETRDITLTIGGQQMHFKGEPYLVHFALPNFYFHATAAYAILRSCGVPLGKRDFLGEM